MSGKPTQLATRRERMAYARVRNGLAEGDLVERSRLRQLAEDYLRRAIGAEEDRLWAAVAHPPIGRRTKPGSTVEHVALTPEMAARLLLSARPVEGPAQPAKVAHFVELIHAGQWRPPAAHDGDVNPVVVDEAGDTIYGLQRLEACIVADTPIPATIVRWPVNRKER